MRRIAKTAVLPVPSPTTMPDSTQLDRPLARGLLQLVAGRVTSLP